VDINFYKLQVLKNDFILCDLRNKASINESFFSSAAVSICDRRSGVGGSGIIYILSADTDSTVMQTYSSDGSLYEFVYDSSLIASRYIFDMISVSGKTIKIINNNIPVTAQIIDSMNFRISAGNPLFNDKITENLIVDNYTYNYTQINLQKKNGIIFFPENKSADELKELGRKLLKSSTHDKSFPVYIFPAARNSITAKTVKNYRHPDNSLICCIASVAASLNGYDNELLVMLHKSAAYVEWDRINNEVYISAKPEYSFTGSYYFDEKNSR